MNFAIRVFAMAVVFAGLVCAPVSSATHSLSSHLSATAFGPGPLSLPAPPCLPCTQLPPPPSN